MSADGLTSAERRALDLAATQAAESAPAPPIEAQVADLDERVTHLEAGRSDA